MQVWNRVGWCCSAMACAAIAVSMPAATAWAQDEDATAALEQRLNAVEQQAEAIAKRVGSVESLKLADELKALRAALDELKGKITMVSPLVSQIQNLDKRLSDLESTASKKSSKKYPFDLELSGYIRAVQTTIVEGDEQQLAFVGLNDGWGLSSARLTLDGDYKDLSFRLQFDGALQRFEEGNAPDGEVRAEAKDAWFQYRLFNEFAIRVGRFKASPIGEELGPTASQLFIENSVGVRGVRNVEGRNVQGLEQGRQYGIMFHGYTIFDAEAEKNDTDALAIRWSLATTNGNNANEPRNDNDDFASTTRAELAYGNSARDKFRVGLGAVFNNKTAGQAPDLIDEQETGAAADLWLDWPVSAVDLIFDAQIVAISRSFPDLEIEPSTTALAWHVAPAIRHQDTGLAAAYRYAFFDPTADSESDDPVLQQQDNTDALKYHTVGVDWIVPDYPLRLQMNYTITIEDDQQAVDNDKFQVLGQIVF